MALMIGLAGHTSGQFKSPRKKKQAVAEEAGDSRFNKRRRVDTDNWMTV